MPRSRLSLGLVVLVLLSVASRADAIVISEIMYRPSVAQTEAAGGRNLEFVEIYNEEPTVLNLSGYQFTDGISFVFPHDTYLEGRSYLVVCADEDAVRDYFGIENTIGNFSGRLDNNGETITLSIFGGGPECSVRYSDRGQWPKEADGTGHTLILTDPYAGDVSDTDNWSFTNAIDGNPGITNLPEPRIVDTSIVPEDAVWRYRKNTTEYPAGWSDFVFDDSTWPTGQTGIGYGDNDDRTELTDMRSNYLSFAARHSFELTQEEIDSFTETLLQIKIDDGFVAFLNGEEFARVSLGATGDPVTHETRASRATEARNFVSYAFDKSLLRVGTNVLAFAVHNSIISSSDCSFIPKIVNRRTIFPGNPTPVRITEGLVRTSGERWFEVQNLSDSEVDLSGYFLSNNPGLLDQFEIPASTSIPAGGYLSFTATETGLDLSLEDVEIFLTQPSLGRVDTAAHFENPVDGDPLLDETSDALLVDDKGSARWVVSTTPTAGAANSANLVDDIVINEIMYNPPIAYPDLPYVELYNRGTESVDLSGFRFTRGISYVFPDGTSLGPDEYLVVAQNPSALETAHAADSLTGVLGPYTGTLASSGENIRLVDLYGNIVDQVRYYDGGRWGRWSDGGGSALELIDADQDNSVPSAWADSDESTKSEWEEIAYSMSYSRQSESEFQIRMLAAGECYMDDISVTRGASEHIRNGGFESNTSPWRIQGTHIQSHRTTEDAFTGNACLKIVATGKGDTRVNRIEQDTSPAMVSATHNVRMRARWLRGGNLLLFSVFAQLPAAQRTHWLSIPENLGSPGRVNSASVENLGPVISEVLHSPPVPAANQSTRIVARVTDSDGVSRVTLRYDPSNGGANSVEMHDDGAHGDGEAGDGLYGANVPGFPNNTRVEFYVQAEDSLGAIRNEPREAPDRDFVYTHDPPLTSRAFTMRLVHDPRNWSLLNSRQLHSNELLDTTFIFNEEKVFYNVGTRYRGSPWNRPGNPRMYRINFQKDDPYRSRRKLNISRYGREHRDRTANYSVWRNSTASTTSPFNRASWARVKTAAGTWILEGMDPTSTDYLNLWFPEDDDGFLMKITGRQIFNDSGGHRSNLLRWADWSNRGNNKANFRWNFNHRTRELEDDFTPLMRLVATMSGSSTVLDNELEDIMDVEQFLRVYAARCAHDDWDTISIGNGQNMYCYYAPLEGRWKLLPWDMDHSWGNTNARTMPDSDARMARILSRPKYRRMYAGIVNEMLNGRGDKPGYWSSGEMVAKFVNRNNAIVGAEGVGAAGNVAGFVGGRRGVFSRVIPGRVTFAITTEGGEDFVVNAASTRLEGNGWVDVYSILINGEPAELTWTTTSRWRTVVDLPEERNDIEVLAIDVEGSIIGTDTITIVSTEGWLPPEVTAVNPVSAQPGDLVTIEGLNLYDGLQVFFDGTESPSVEFSQDVDGTTITAEVPFIRDGVVGVTVRNIDDRASEAFDFTVLPLSPHFVRGDANRDDEITVSDAVRIVRFLFAGLDAPCADAADVDANNEINVTDAIRVLAFLYQEGPAPEAPFPEMGIDPDQDEDVTCVNGADPF